MRLQVLSILQISLLLPLAAAGAGPWCFQCKDAFHPAACQETVACGEHESCYTEKTTTNNGAQTYSSGCKPTGDCSTIVKRSSTVECSECCTGTLCNQVLCKADRWCLSTLANHSRYTTSIGPFTGGGIPDRRKILRTNPGCRRGPEVHASMNVTHLQRQVVYSSSNKVSSTSRLWCADCSYQTDPAGCDHVTLCSIDQMCSIATKTIFGRTTYDLGCDSPSQCSNKTLAADNKMCCKSDLCNTNLFGMSPDSYTSPPPSTTTPTPGPASATINETDINYISHNGPNETLAIHCLLGGYPTPNVTWLFIPAPSNTSTTPTTTTTTTTPATTITTTTATTIATTTAANTTSTTTTASGNATTSPTTTGSNGNSTAGGNTTGSGAGGVTGQEIKSGVTTSNGISTLVITSPSGSDAGQYICHVDNGMGPAVESNVTVTFGAAPIIAGAGNETVQLSVRDDVLLDCDAEGVPEPSVMWVYPGTAGGVEELSNGSLILHNVHADNTGDYVCVAKNAHGHDAKTFTVDVDDNSTAPCPTIPTSTLLSSTGTFSITSPLTSATSPLSTASSTVLITGTSTTPTTGTTPPSTTPLVCPTLPTITTTTPTTSPTTTPTTTTMSSTTTSTTTTTTPTTPTTTPTTPTTTTTTPTTTTTTPTTTTTTPSTTPTTTTTTQTSTSSSTSPSSTTTSTTTSSSTTTTTAALTAVGNLWHDRDGGVAVLQCAPHPLPGMTSAPPVTWSRLEQDYDHTDTKTYTENGHGVLVVTPQAQSLTSDGIYQCHMLGGSANDTAEFVVYTSIPGPIDCRQEFGMGMGNTAPGVVFRTTCGPCQNAPMQTNNLIWRDQICNSAVSRNVIPATGGTVTWLLKKNNQVALLKEENSHVVLVT